MSEPRSPQALDFHSPRRPSTEAWRRLAAWHGNLCPILQDAWGALLAQPIQLKPGVVEPMQHHTALGRLPDDGLGVCYALGESMLPAMVVFSGRQVQGLISDLLDLPGSEWPPLRPTTAVEDAMLELLFQSLAESWGEAWPESRPLSCRYLEASIKPQRTRLFPVGEPLFVGKIKIQSRFGEETCTWLTLKDEIEQLILECVSEPEPEERGLHPQLMALTERVPAQLVVELGRADLSMSQVANLNVGDVLVLDQFVSHPLIAKVEGLPKWSGTPLRIGSRQAFEVQQLIEDAHPPSTLPWPARPPAPVR